MPLRRGYLLPQNNLLATGKRSNNQVMTHEEFIEWLDKMIKDCDTAASLETTPAREYWSGQSSGISLVKEKFLTLLPPPTLS